MRILSKLLKAAGLAAVASAALAPAAAHAAWLKAETDRFVVYGDSDSASVSAYARKLTIYDEALRVMNPGVKDRATTQKVEVYMVRSNKDLDRVMPKASLGMAGFYTTSPHGVMAVATTNHKYEDFGADTVLFHEYAHHFLLENFPSAYPGWFNEGWAEYFSTAEITPKGVTVGGYNKNRVDWLFEEPWIPLEDVLRKSPFEVKGADSALYYAESWDLMHYMRDTPERAAQLNQAIREITAGSDPVTSIEKVTGKPLDSLTRDLKNYIRLQMVIVPAKLIDMNPAVKLSAMTPAADDLLLENARLNLSDPGDKGGEALLEDIRARAARYPDDRLADQALARAEFLFGDVKAGEAIVTKRLIADPSDLEFIRLAGEGQMYAGDREPAHRAERYRAARPLLARAYELNKDDFRPLLQYVISRSVEPGFPTENDQNAVLQAHFLAPAVEETSIVAGRMLLRAGHKDDAVKVLSLVANNPHGGKAAAMARALIAGKTPAQAEAAAAAATSTAPGAPDPKAAGPGKAAAPAASAQSK